MTVLCKVPTHIVNPLLTPSPLPPGLFISNTFEGETGSIEVGGLFDRWGGGGLINLAKMMVSVLHEELECKVEKLNHKKLEVMQLRIKNKSELPTHE